MIAGTSSNSSNLTARPGAARAARAVEVDRCLCVACGLCTGVCVTLALSLDALTAELLYISGRCTGCGECIEACPLGAIRRA